VINIMSPIAILALAAIPPELKRWNRSYWEGMTSEHFTTIEQICHIRDIDIDRYCARLRPTPDIMYPISANIFNA